jgi:hypothetical protein
MADPTTLVDYTAQGALAAQAAADAAHAEADAARAAVDAARAALAAAVADIAAHAAAARRLRDALAVVATPADAAPLLVALDTETINQRLAEAAALAAEGALAMARGRAAVAPAAAKGADAALAAARLAQGAAGTSATQRAAQAAALAAAPLATLAADATALLASATYDAAEAAAEDGLPARLLALARSRAAAVFDHQANTHTLRYALGQAGADQAAADGGPRDRCAAPQAAYDAACAALAAVVNDSAATFGRVQTALQRLATPGRPGLTAQQRASLADATQQAARETAADHAAALDSASVAREAAEFAQDAEQARADAGLPNTLPAAQAALPALQQAETDARNNFPDAERDLLREWAAAAPDGAWRDLQALEDARRVLGRLAGVVAADLVNAVVGAEAALVAALLAADVSQSRRAATAARLAARNNTDAAADALVDRSAFAALRGDA